MFEGRQHSVAAFLGLCILVGVAIVGLVYWAGSRVGSVGTSKNGSSLPGVAVTEWQAERIYFRNNLLGPDYGKLAFVDQRRPKTREIVDQLSCEVVHVSASRGLCLVADRGVITTYSAAIFDTNDYAVLEEIPLAGVPSRTRVSGDGRRGAITVFVTGHGYDSVDFSTQTILVDMVGAEVIAELETFTVFRSGEAINREDFNFWGVTFAADHRSFFATLSTDRQHLLVRGDIPSRTAEVIHEDVECPSLSPDGSRVAFKRRKLMNGNVSWQLYVLDLSTNAETKLAEPRSVDDQLAWLDANYLLYTVPRDGLSPSTDVWIVQADGRGEPRIFLEGAYSPAVAR